MKRNRTKREKKKKKKIFDKVLKCTKSEIKTEKKSKEQNSTLCGLQKKIYLIATKKNHFYFLILFFYTSENFNTPFFSSANFFFSFDFHTNVHPLFLMTIFPFSFFFYNIKKWMCKNRIIDSCDRCCRNRQKVLELENTRNWIRNFCNLFSEGLVTNNDTLLTDINCQLKSIF